MNQFYKGYKIKSSDRQIVIINEFERLIYDFYLKPIKEDLGGGDGEMEKTFYYGSTNSAAFCALQCLYHPFHSMQLK